MSQKLQKQKKKVIICGDYNVAHEPIDLKNPKKKDFELAKKGFEFAEKIITKNNKNNKNDKRNAPDLLVLDELALASAYGLIDVNLILKFLKRVPIKTTVIITGRKTPKELIKAADLVTEMKCIKHPYQKGEKAKKGIEF